MKKQSSFSPTHTSRPVVYGILFFVYVLSASYSFSDSSRKTAFDEIRSGQYAVPISQSAEVNAQARSRVLEFIDAIHSEQSSARRNLVRDPENKTKADYELEEIVECDRLLELCRLTEGTESGLTAALVLGTRAIGWSEVREYRPIEEALDRVNKRFPDAWQSYVAPLLQAQLILRRKDVVGRNQATQDAVNYLKSCLPEKDVEINPTDPELQALSKLFKFKHPLRAAYLVSIATLQYNAATSGMTINIEYLDQAVSTCKQIITEYPDTEHAMWADDIANRRAPVLRNMP